MSYNSIKVNQQSINNNTPPHQNQSFKGGIIDGATAVLSYCDKYPMLNVSIIDGITAIGPRTALDARTNGFAAFETFRRESSGLIVNCLIPSFFVLGVAKLLQPLAMNGLKHLNMASVWANEGSINTLADFYDKAGGATKEERIKSYVSDVLHKVSAIRGKEEIAYSSQGAKLNDAINIVTEAIVKDKQQTAEGVTRAYSKLVKLTQASEILKIDGKNFGSNLEGLLGDMIELGRRFKLDEVGDNLANFKMKSRNLINSKSIIGLAIIIPLAMSMQSINRAITKYTSGSHGAPIYKDFGSKDHKPKVHSDEDKKSLFFHKLLSVGAMLGVAVTSMWKMPTMQMFQFKGIFPTLDQCRWISAATFGSRMAVAEDKNELRETVVRDIATFASLYWLGDYAAKLTATVFEKLDDNVKLLNYKKVVGKDASVASKVINWIGDAHLKSFDEVANHVKTKNLRTVCQLSSLGFSTLLLGLLIPWYTRKQTERNERKEQQKKVSENTQAIKDLFYYHKRGTPQIFQKFSGLQNSTN